MRLIIDIDDEMVCKDIKSKALYSTSLTDEVIINALYNGIPYKERPQGDLISREALKERIQLAPNKNEETWEELYDSIIYEIDNAPTVEQKHTLNDSISNIKLVCKSNNVCCIDCPMNYNCKEEPARWEIIKNETDN